MFFFVIEVIFPSVYVMLSIKAVALPSAAGVVASIASINPFNALPCAAESETEVLSLVKLFSTPRYVSISPTTCH